MILRNTLTEVMRKAEIKITAVNVKYNTKMSLNTIMIR